MAGGDVLETHVAVESNAHALITTPGAAKYYRCASDLITVKQNIVLDNHSVLEWFPQESVLFDGTKASLETRIDLHDDAAFIGWDIQCLGRTAIEEHFDNGQMQSSLLVFRNKRPLLIDRLQVDQFFHARQATGFRKHPVHGLMLSTGVGKELEVLVKSRLADVHDCAATLLNDVLLVRYLGDNAEHARWRFADVWGLLRPAVIGRAATTPRIWNT
jgi:urease accessory protein